MGDAEGTRLPNFRVQWSDRETEDRRSARWAAEQPKRYMAAGFSVGTIDQALLGALAVKHAHLRAACLVRHLLVIDEVHSSDAYMTTLAERLMTLFRASGGHVLLMSATVGAGTRERLVHGRKSAPVLAAAIATPYPRITSSHAAPVDIASEGPGKTVAIEPIPLIDRPEAVAALAAEAVGAGARVLVLRNTVTAAIATQEGLEALLPPAHDAFFRVGEVRTLHHGRFAAEDRRLLDVAVEGRFGKTAGSGPALIVATQTLEQSLDVDADLLITDLAPIDVLLQRIGRLHRHSHRVRPEGFAEARCIVLLPEADDLVSFLHRARHGIGPERAYDNVLAVEATRQMVAEAPHWTIPADNRRLVEEGTHDERLRRLADQLGAQWAKHWGAYFGGEIGARAQARDNSINYNKPFRDTEWPPAAEKLATRLGAQDLLLPLEPALRSPFGQMLERLKLPRWMAPKKLPAEIPSAIVSGDFMQFGGSTYRYDRFGLQLMERH
jgi:CRISPR-associated endonuclease/helicase Cas3